MLLVVCLGGFKVLAVLGSYGGSNRVATLFMDYIEGRLSRSLYLPDMMSNSAIVIAMTRRRS